MVIMNRPKEARYENITSAIDNGDFNIFGGAIDSNLLTPR